MVQHLQINQHDIPQNETKAYDHLSNAEKAFDKIQYSFMIKKLKTGIEEYLNIIRPYMTNPQLSHSTVKN